MTESQDDAIATLQAGVEGALMAVGAALSAGQTALMIPDLAMYIGAQTENANLYSWGATQNGLLSPSSNLGTIDRDKEISSKHPGRLGGKQHQDKIAEIESSIKDQYGEEFFAKTELKVNTPGGQKPFRYIDLAVIDSKRDPVVFYQVGRSTVNANPVSRERIAINDIYNFGIKPSSGNYDVPIIFIPYD